MFAPDAPGELGDLPNPDMLRRPTMRREAQSTSALEGTFEPLETVLAQDYEVGEDKSGLSESMREVLNYLDAAECGIGQIQSGHPISLHSRARIAEASCEGHEVRQSTGLGYTIHPSVHRLTHAAHRGCAFRAHASGANRAVAGAVADDEPRPAEPAAAVRIPVVRAPSTRISGQIARCFHERGLRRLDTVLLPRHRGILRGRAAAREASCQCAAEVSQSIG